MTKKIFLLRVSLYTSLNPHPHDLLPPFSLAYIATLLEQEGHAIVTCDMLVENKDVSEVVSSVLRFDPDILIIDCISTACQSLKYICERITAKIICIGHYASSLPYHLLCNNPTVNICVYGEPEYSTLETVEALIKNTLLSNILGIVYRDKNGKIFKNESRPLLESLDGLPPIKYALFKYQRYKMNSFHVPIFQELRWGFLITSRGCPYECIFCSATLRHSFGKKYRKFSAVNVVRQVSMLLKDYKVNVISFQDDDFCSDKSHVIEICKEIIHQKIKVKFGIQTRADKIDDEVLFFLKKAGCVCIAIGVEAGSDRVLRILKKGTTKDAIREAVTKIQSSGIGFKAYFMVGNPSETLEEMEETLSFAKELLPNIIQVAFFSPYPGSSFFENELKTKLAAQEETTGDVLINSPDELKNIEIKLEEIHHYDKVSTNPSCVPTDTLINFRNQFYLRFYFSLRFLTRYFYARAPFAFINNNEAALVSNALTYLLRKKPINTTRRRCVA